MKKLFPFFIISVLCTAAIAQNTNISGQINSYSKVTAITYCGNRVTVDLPSLFHVGMQVLLIQMKGATIDTSNSTSYGNVLSYSDAGNYEIQVIDSIIADTIKFTYEIERLYDPAHSVQLIPLPVYQTATVTNVLTCKPWDGNTGGILLLKADTLILNDTIDITATGFRGFYDNDSSQLCFGNLTDYFYTDSMHGALKGEGISNSPYIFGRGKNANGGGGGDNQNTGGGGGSNFSTGGAGGTIVPRTAFCMGNGPGDGGGALAYSDSLNKIFMGGGGGCGHGNNSEGTPGTNGAGICMILANVVIGNNQYIVANGFDQNNLAGSDGAGGGGAGGTVMMDVGQYVGNLYINTNGGLGGSLTNDYLTHSCMGPAGGGSGGVLWVNQATVPANIIYSAPGGLNGMNIGTGSTFCPFGVTNGALPGDSGGSVTGWVPPISLTPYIRLSATISNDTVLCNDQQLTLSATGISSDSVYYSWSTGQQTASVSFLASQTQPYGVTVTDQNGCSVSRQVNVTVYVVSPVFSPGTSLCTPQTITLSATNPGTTAVTYAWSTGANTPTITFVADSSQVYTVTVFSDSLHSCIATDTIPVSVGNLIVTYTHDTAVCPGNPVTLSATLSSGAGVSFIWSNGDTSSSITVIPTTNITYDVTVSAAGGCISTHSFVIAMDYLGISPPLMDTTICPGGTALLDVIVPNDSNLTYHWSSGQSTQQINISPGSATTYVVTVTSSNGCTGLDSATVFIDSVRFNSSDTAICPGSAAVVTAHVLGIGAVDTYLWGGGQNTHSITVTPTDSQTYTVTATDSLGCQASETISVAVNNTASHLSIQVTALPDSSLGPGDSIELSVTGARMMSYLWTPGQYLSDSMIESPIATPLKATDYCVEVTDSSNCSAVACEEVYVGIPPADVALPTAFSPNGDGKNDLYIVVPLEGTVVASVRIYDREGMLVYESDTNQGWDGTFKGAAQESNEYLCFVTYYQKIYPNVLFHKQGTFDLFR